MLRKTIFISFIFAIFYTVSFAQDTTRSAVKDSLIVYSKLLSSELAYEKSGKYFLVDEGSPVVFFNVKKGISPQIYDYQFMYDSKECEFRFKNLPYINNLTITKWLRESDSVSIKSRRIKAGELSNAIKRLKELETEKDSLDKIIEISAALKQMRLYGLGITDYSVNGGDYSAGIKIELFNPNKKTIKYVYITLNPYNAVNDLTNNPKTVRGIGPIKPNESASFEFEDVFYSRVIDKVKVSQIKLLFMDGSSKIISKAVIPKITYYDE